MLRSGREIYKSLCQLILLTNYKFNQDFKMELDWMDYVGFAAFIWILLYTFFAKKKKCPKCSEPLPKYRSPANIIQIFWEGWTCQKCGSEVGVDIKGRARLRKK